MTDANKYDSAKAPMDLLPARPLTEIAQVLAFGANKYDAHNWRKGMSWSRLLGALLRHAFAYLGGEDSDPESGLSHMAHAGCCVLFLLEYAHSHPEKDDRYKPEAWPAVKFPPGEAPGEIRIVGGGRLNG